MIAETKKPPKDYSPEVSLILKILPHLFEKRFPPLREQGLFSFHFIF